MIYLYIFIPLVIFANSAWAMLRTAKNLAEEGNKPTGLGDTILLALGWVICLIIMISEWGINEDAEEALYGFAERFLLLDLLLCQRCNKITIKKYCSNCEAEIAKEEL